MSSENRREIETRKKRRYYKKPAVEKIQKMMTKSRLTMKVGLFNNGKKSDTITRVVSEETKARANEDLKRILQLASSPENKRRKNNIISSRPSTSSVEIDYDDDDSDSFEESFEPEFPLSPPTRLVAEKLSKVFDKKIPNLYPGRDYLQESKDDLRQLLAENKDVPLFIGPQTTQSLPSASNESVFCLNVPNNYFNDQESMQNLKYLRLIEENSVEPVPQVETTVGRKWDEVLTSNREYNEEFYCPSSCCRQREKASSSTCRNMDVFEYLDQIDEDDDDTGTECESDGTPCWRNLFSSSPCKPTLYPSPSPPLKFYRRRLY